MGLFIQLFGNLVAFAYHCFDRIVIYGYLTGLSRPDQVVHFFRQVVGVAVITKETLSQRTDAYQTWVEAFARNHRIPIRWAEKGVRKEDYVLPWLRRMVRKDTYGVYHRMKPFPSLTSHNLSPSGNFLLIVPVSLIGGAYFLSGCGSLNVALKPVIAGAVGSVFKGIVFQRFQNGNDCWNDE
jgi:hypothetical protein